MKYFIALFALFCSFQSFAGSTSEVNCLTAAIYKEARSEPLKCQQAVAEVIMNRAEHPGYPDSICKVIKQPKQFPWYQGETREFQKLLKGDLRHLNHKESSAYLEAKIIASRVYYGDFEGYPELKDALFFHSVSVNPGWKKKKKAKIGRHIFY